MSLQPNLGPIRVNAVSVCGAVVRQSEHLGSKRSSMREVFNPIPFRAAECNHPSLPRYGTRSIGQGVFSYRARGSRWRAAVSHLWVVRAEERRFYEQTELKPAWSFLTHPPKARKIG